jgi:hypothetical protein
VMTGDDREAARENRVAQALVLYPRTVRTYPIPIGSDGKHNT